MRRHAALGCLAALWVAAPAAAQDLLCEDWWFARNLIFDRAGYCFTSPLGQALFDNADCTTRAPDLRPDLAALVAEIRARETEEGCAVDTARTALSDPGAVEPYRLMEDIPVREPFESGCIGYRGAPVAVRTGLRPDAPVAGTIAAGASIGFGHVPRGASDYIVVLPDPDSLKGAFWGWADFPPGPLPCDVQAG
ncbi:DUF4453 domain-containing protein [Roseicyclus persicicus]|uniref:DUF4453 domain-containing protein n=1 Tax=Roseicyclus persicicus TaxID=2650661 RepID=A0A7X6GXS9_9RHOB|nr:DUF4453 domain-containing protein [Roseibacterium persicicum]NKX43271.1 DUF4453 domain-containing protein [Roseibacterium persicicum]